MLQELTIIAVRGIGLGSLLSLVAMSLIVVKVSSGVLNFAQGNMVLLGAIAGYLLNGLTGGGLVVWLVMLIPASLLIGAAMSVQGYVTLLPLRYDNTNQSWLITTMAASILISATLLYMQGPSPVHLENVWPDIQLFGTGLPLPYVLTFLLALAWYMFLNWFSSRTIPGLAISALWQDQIAARALGLPVRRLQVLAFAISGAIAGSGGYVAGSIIPVTVESGFQLILGGFTAWVVGGFASNGGALVAGPLVGVVGMLSAFYVGGAFQTLTQTLLLIAILMMRPEGLFGNTSVRKV